MAKLLMITSLGSAQDLAQDKKGAFYNTLEEFHQYWERIDIISPRVIHIQGEALNVDNPKVLFGNVHLHISPWPLIFHPIWFLKKGLEIYREQKFDLMTVQEFPPFYNGLGARLLWQKIKVPYVLEIHHVPGYPRGSSFKEKIYQQLMKLFIRSDAKKAVAVRVVNQKEVPDFLKKSGVPEEKIKHIPSLYLDLETFQPRPVEKEHDLIFVGRLVENKGINLFLEAVRKSGLNALIVGDGPLFKEIRLKTINNKLKTKLWGWAKDSSEVAELLNKSRILIMPSFNEGGPRVVGEAMACGVPVLATPVGIVPDVIKEVGELIDWQADDIVAKAKALLVDQERYARYSLAGVEIAKRFEKKEMIKNYAEQLKLLIK